MTSHRPLWCRGRNIPGQLNQFVAGIVISQNVVLVLSGMMFILWDTQILVSNHRGFERPTSSQKCANIFLKMSSDTGLKVSFVALHAIRTSCHSNDFRVTGPLCRLPFSIGIPDKRHKCEVLMFPLVLFLIYCWTCNWSAGDLRLRNTHVGSL